MPHSQETPCQCLTSQSKDLQEALQKIKELASENAALKEQMAAKEAGWDAEKSRILKALYAERALHKKVKADLRQKMEAGMKKVAEKTPIQEAKHQSNSTVEQVDSDRMASARQEIAMWKHRHDTVFDCWKTEVRSLKALLASQEEASNSKCEAIEQDLSSVLEEAASQLNQSTEEKAQLTARVAALEAQNKESSDLIKYLQINLQYNQANWRLRVSDLEEKVSSQQRESTRMVELWCQRESILKEEVQLLTQKNSQLEEFSAMTDKEKKKKKKEEEKARKMEEKRLKEERKVEKERERESLKREAREAKQKKKEEKRQRKYNEEGEARENTKRKEQLSSLQQS